MSNKPNPFQGKKILFATTSDPTNLAKYSGPGVVVAVMPGTTPEEVAAIRATGADVAYWDPTVSGNTVADAQNLGINIVIGQVEGPSQLDNYNAAYAGKPSNVTMGMVTSNGSAYYSPNGDFMMVESYPGEVPGQTVSSSMANTNSVHPTMAVIPVIGGSNSSGNAAYAAQAAAAAAYGSYGIFPPGPEADDDIKSMLNPKLSTGSSASSSPKPKVITTTENDPNAKPGTKYTEVLTLPGEHGEKNVLKTVYVGPGAKGWVEPDNATGQTRDVTSTGGYESNSKNKTTDSTNPTGLTRDVTSTGGYDLPPNQYSGGATVVKTIWVGKDHNTRIDITATGAVIETAPGGTPQRAGWIDPSTIDGVNDVTDLKGNIKPGSSNPYTTAPPEPGSTDNTLDPAIKAAMTAQQTTGQAQTITTANQTLDPAIQTAMNAQASSAAAANNTFWGDAAYNDEQGTTASGNPTGHGAVADDGSTAPSSNVVADRGTMDNTTPPTGAPPEPVDNSTPNQTTGDNTFWGDAAYNDEQGTTASGNPSGHGALADDGSSDPSATHGNHENYEENSEMGDGAVAIVDSSTSDQQPPPGLEIADPTTHVGGAAVD